MLPLVDAMALLLPSVAHMRLVARQNLGLASGG